MVYPFSKIEKKWTKKWLDSRVYEPDLLKAKKPFYNLMMFPYPSAEGLHVGNMYAFVGSDIYGRFQRMQGNDVFEPIGLDGFGIHSENYALKIGTHPAKQAQISEKNFYRQLSSIGNGFAWNEHLETYDPEYYKWTQWIFIQLFKRGLAYRKKQSVNWCPSCKTVLADEQVIDGKCERCGTKVIKKELEQWFFRITKYADRLLRGLDGLDWSEKVKIAQRNWIGKSEGALIEFPAFAKASAGKQISKADYQIEVFTTRPDTIFGATYMVLAPEHELASSIKYQVLNWRDVEKYIKKTKAKSEEERIAEGKVKTGIELKGIKAINPATKKEIPVWVADYVLGNVGTGAIMAVPAHDERDFEFAKKYKLPLRRVILKNNAPIRSYLMGAKDVSDDDLRKLEIQVVERTKSGSRKIIIPKTAVVAYEELIGKKMTPGFWNEYVGDKAVFIFKYKDGRVEKKILSNKNESELNELCEKFNNSKFGSPWRMLAENSWYTDVVVHPEEGILMDSGKFSGVHSERAKWEITKFAGGKRKIQYRLRDWLISRQRYWGPPIPMIYCEKCGWQPVPEKDLPVRLPLVKNFRPTGRGKSPLASVQSFYEVKCPKCGGKAKRETDVSDTFLDSAWYFFRYLDHQNKKGPFSKERAKRWLPVDTYIGGAEHAVLHLLYSRFITMVFKDMGLISFDEPYSKFRAHGLLISEGAKMSKSKGNVVIPDEYIKKFGADVVRAYLMFIGPFIEGGDWRDAGIMGPVRFLNRVWDLGAKQEIKSKRQKEGKSDVSFWLHASIKEITEDIAELKYNTAISELMVILNKLEKESQINRKDWEAFLLLLAPFAPFIAEELWEKLGGHDAYQGRGSDRKRRSKYSIHKQSWPKYDPGKLTRATATLIIQINGKFRSQIEAQSGTIEKEAEKLALADPKVQKFTSGKKIKKIIFVKDKLINFVI